MLEWMRRRSETTQSLLVSVTLGVVVLGVCLVLTLIG